MSVLRVLAEGEGTMSIHPYAVGAIALLLFLILLVATFAFRGYHNKVATEGTTTPGTGQGGPGGELEHGHH